MQYWILKTEPSTYSFDDLLRDKSTVWDGVRNYQARNNLKSMHIGDQCLIYHSVGPKELVGIAEVTHVAFQDPTTSDDRWVAVKIKPVCSLKHPITLAALKDHPVLANLSLVRQGRLSVCPVTAKEWRLMIKGC